MPEGADVTVPEPVPSFSMVMGPGTWTAWSSEVELGVKIVPFEESPEYSALMEWFPADNKDVEHAAEWGLPAESGTPPQIVCVPSLKDTLPPSLSIAGYQH